MKGWVSGVFFLLCLFLSVSEIPLEDHFQNVNLRRPNNEVPYEYTRKALLVLALGSIDRECYKLS